MQDRCCLHILTSLYPAQDPKEVPYLPQKVRLEMSPPPGAPCGWNSEPRQPAPGEALKGRLLSAALLTPTAINQEIHIKSAHLLSLARMSSSQAGPTHPRPAWPAPGLLMLIGLLLTEPAGKGFLGQMCEPWIHGPLRPSRQTLGAINPSKLCATSHTGVKTSGGKNLQLLLDPRESSLFPFPALFSLQHFTGSEILLFLLLVNLCHKKARSGRLMSPDPKTKPASPHLENESADEVL